uniref:Htaa domain-containing protein n=1 Tax=Streptomyces sp. NBC_01401 TaxID=2903854 RepID=A0AAU3GQY1_9ACTN
MDRSGTKRPGLKSALIVVAAVVAMLPASATATAETQAAAGHGVTSSSHRASSSPVGRWELEVSFEGDTYTSSAQFTPAGRAFLPNGGAGRWTSTGAGRFTFRIAEPIFDGSGNYLGWVDVSQTAVLSSDGTTFTSSGTSRQYDPSDQLARTVHPEDTGRRV